MLTLLLSDGALLGDRQADGSVATRVDLVAGGVPRVGRSCPERPVAAIVVPVVVLPSGGWGRRRWGKPVVQKLWL